jgi:hypothetical protein
MVRTMRLTLLLAAALPALAHDWLIVPGERVGPITARSTEASLREAFGSAAIVPATIQIDKTTAAPGAEIYRGKPGESLAVVWPRKERGLWWPLLAIPCYGSKGPDCRWRTAAGVRVGLSVAELEKLNGKPFLLYRPLDREPWSEPWWDEGKLASQLGEDVELSFDDPGSPGDISDAYLRSSEKPLAGRSLRITRCFVFLLSRGRVAPANDWTIVPGERFGPIPMGAAAEPLRETLGAAQVHRVLASADEGLGDIPGISIFGGSRGRQVLLRRDGNQICGGTDGYKTCEWHIAGGIPLSTTVEALEKLNGRPFVFNGCCFDLGGIIISWEGGRMARLLKARFAVGCGHDQPARLIGEVSVRSDDPDIRRLKCTVVAIDF